MFNSPITGSIPNSNFIMTTTELITDDITCTNLTATNANITNLTAITFSPANINTGGIFCDTIEANTATIEEANITNATINTLNSTTINNSDTIASTILNSDELIINDTIRIGAGARFFMQSEIFKICAQSTTSIYQADISFYSNKGTGTPKLRINRGDDVVDIIKLRVSEDIETESLLVNDEITSNIINATSIISTTIQGDISSNLLAGTGISLSTTSGITTITNTGIVTDPLTINTLNSKNINNEFTITTDKISSKTIELVDTNNGNVSLFTKSNNVLNFFGTYLSTPIDINFFTKLYTSNQPIFQLLGNDNKVVVNSLLETQHIDCTSLHSTGLILTATLSSDIINSYYEMFINDRNGTSAKTQIHRTSDYFEMYNPNTSGPYKFYTGFNTGTPQFQITNSGIIGDISSNLQAGIGISLSSSNGITTITNTGIVTDPLTINTLNSTTINNSGTIASTILNSDELLINDTIQIGAGARFFMQSEIFKICAQSNTSIYQADISFYSNKGTGTPKLRINRGDNVVDVIKLRVSQDIESENLLVNDEITSNIINATTINSTTINNSGNIIASTLTADISSNLIGGSGIALTTNSGVTTIESTGGLSTSTQYAFQVTSNLNNNQSITTGSIAVFDAIEICVPSTSAYNTAGYYYTCPVAGLYKFGVKAFINSDVDNFRLAIWKNSGILMAMGGAGSEASEAFETIDQMAAGETVYIGCVTGQALVYMAAKHSWWYGHLLQPENNTVGITTDLTVATLNADLVGATEMVSTLITSGFMNTGILTATTINGNISNNLDSGNNINLVTVAGVTTINAQIPSSYTDLTINNLTSTSITTDTITATTANIINLSTPLLGVGSFFTRRQNIAYSPGSSSQQYFSNFDTAVVSNPHVSWVAPNIGSGGANTGFIINTSGTYKIDWTFIAHSVSYNNRIGWFTRLYKNGAPWDDDRYVGFIYTRGDQTSFAQWGSSSSHCIVNLVAGDYIHLVTNIAKATPVFNNLWDQVEAGWGAVCSFQILAFA